MQRLVYSRIYLHPQALEAHFVRFEIFRRYIERNVMEHSLVQAWLLGFGVNEHAVGRIKEGEILGVTAIALCDFEENRTLISPQHFESSHFFVKLIHCAQVFDAAGHLAYSFDMAG